MFERRLYHHVDWLLIAALAGAFVGAALGTPKEKRTLSKFLRGDADVGYYEGEG